jgi:hypothetical protein
MKFFGFLGRNMKRKKNNSEAETYEKRILKNHIHTNIEWMGNLRRQTKMNERNQIHRKMESHNRN